MKKLNKVATLFAVAAVATAAGAQTTGVTAANGGNVVDNCGLNFPIPNNNIHDIRTGILIDGRNTGSVTNNRIDNTKSAISVQYTDGTGYDKSAPGSDAVQIAITGHL